GQGSYEGDEPTEANITTLTADQLRRTHAKWYRWLGRTEPLTPAQAADRMGPIAEAFALDQRMTGARARRELGWKPQHTDALTELARPLPT
ncbi:hypothetical protein ACFWNS_40285, partial [Streptomyces sp. NPDC058418]